MSLKRSIALRVNGVSYQAEIEPRRLLVDFLRDDLLLTGTHAGCEHGVCGACTILVDGAAVRSCLILAIQADGSEITTVEGLADGDHLHPLQEEIWANHGLQCGFCTPGILMTACEFLRENSHPSQEEIREGISGNICRCTGYVNIVKAIQSAASKMESH